MFVNLASRSAVRDLGEAVKSISAIITAPELSGDRCQSQHARKPRKGQRTRRSSLLDVCGLGLRTSAAVFALGLLAVEGFAQEVAPSFGELPQVLEVGDTVVLTVESGEEIRGRVVDLSAASIAVRTGAEPQGRTFPANSVAQIFLTDGVGNGIAWGALIGGIAGILSSAGAAGSGDEGRAAAILGGLGVAGGAAAGWGLDSLTPGTVVYTAPRQARNPMFMLSPLVSQRQQGIRIAFSF